MKVFSHPGAGLNHLGVCQPRQPSNLCHTFCEEDIHFLPQTEKLHETVIMPESTDVQMGQNS